MLNAALDLRDEDFEIIEGEKIMSPSPNINHTLIAMRLGAAMVGHLAEKNRGWVMAEIDVHFPDGSLVKPDLIAVSFENHKIMSRKNAIYGVPDMTVEIFSRSTMRRDFTIKKDVYERNGVKEYWIINPWSKTVSVNILRDGKFFLDEIYSVYDEDDLAELTDKEKAAVKFEIPVSVFDGLKIKVADIFAWCS